MKLFPQEAHKTNMVRTYNSTKKKRGKKARGGGKGGLTICPRCGKEMQTVSINRHAAQCRSRRGKGGRTHIDAQILATAASLFAQSGGQFTEDDAGSIATNEYVCGDSTSGDGEFTGAGPSAVPENITVSRYQKNWMTFLRDDEDDEDYDDGQEEEEDDDGGGGCHVDEDELVGESRSKDKDDSDGADGDEAQDSSTAMATLNQQTFVTTGGLLDSTEQRFRLITNRDLYRPKLDWTWQQPPLDSLPASKLRDILRRDGGETIGLCYEVGAMEEPPLQLSDEELSMVRLIDFCEMNPINGRRFLDGFLDLVAEEMRVGSFNPASHP